MTRNNKAISSPVRDGSDDNPVKDVLFLLEMDKGFMRGSGVRRRKDRPRVGGVTDGIACADKPNRLEDVAVRSPLKAARI
jgi:hypothetical protein